MSLMPDEGREVHAVLNFEVRPLTGPEVPVVLELLSAADALRTIGEDAWTPAELEEWIAHEPEFCLGAESGSDLIGVCLGHLHASARKLHVEDLIVAPETRRCGVASALISALQSAASRRVNGRVRYVALVAADNEIAQATFARRGFARGPEFAWMQVDYP
jgi:ribosomal protein S18 acetylase RimI-like enzyme